MRYSYEIGPIKTRPRTFFERLRKASCPCRRNEAPNHDHYLEMSNRIFSIKTLAEALRAKDEQGFQFQLKIPKVKCSARNEFSLLRSLHTLFRH
jgi:hypothetical protein